MSTWGKSLIIVWLILIALTGLVACNADEEETSLPNRATASPTMQSLVTYTEDREPCDCCDENRNLYFGDLHAHTKLSYDTFVCGEP